MPHMRGGRINVNHQIDVRVTARGVPRTQYVMEIVFVDIRRVKIQTSVKFLQFGEVIIERVLLI